MSKEETDQNVNTICDADDVVEDELDVYHYTFVDEIMNDIAVAPQEFEGRL